MDDLPGAEFVLVGLDDLRAGRTTLEALLVSIAATRLRDLGLDVPDAIGDAEHRLWSMLAADDSDSAHARYNALLQRLVSFQHAHAWPSHRREDQDVSRTPRPVNT